MAVDWLAIKTEYITTNISYRKLAEKWGIDPNEIYKTGGREGWVELRKQHKSKAEADAVEKVRKNQVRQALRLVDTASLALEKLSRKVELINPEKLDTKEMRQICASLLDLKNLLGIQSEMDEKEQNARIANLERQANKEESGKEPVTVVMEDGLEDYAG